MADQLYLSYWLNGFSESSMLRNYEKMLRLFPFSRLANQAALFRLSAVNLTLPPVLEQAFPMPVDIPAVVEAAREFLGPDSSMELECAWDLWQWTPESDWKLAPSRAILICNGPAFEQDPKDNLRVEFGLEAHFLPDPQLPNSLHRAQSNIRSLLKLTHDLDDALGGERRLWSESGENFAEKLQRLIVA